MDGTLTEPRKQIQDPMTNQLLRIIQSGIDIGIVTGSPEKYVVEQIGSFIEAYQALGKDYVPNKTADLHILPCNGTIYISETSCGRTKIPPRTMTQELGEDSFYSLTAAIASLQAEILGQMRLNNLALTGDFIQYRGSMINWCPIGRNANSEQRQEFVNFDNKSGFRQEYKGVLEGWIDYKGMKDKLTVALGGSTSFDIYPAGWDKTYATTWFGDYQCWFIGDKCQPGGNDYHLYNKLQEYERAYETTGPAQTIEIIKEIMNTLSPDSSAG